MRNKYFLLVFIIILSAFSNEALFAQIICNPLNLNYRFCLDSPSRREAADPTVINFRHEYFLFASKSGGYWHSKDLIKWNLITTKDLPLEDYAPTAVVIGDSVYFIASSGKNGSIIYKTADPLKGKWQIANDKFPFGLVDPDLFLDDDGRLYLYYGCSDKDPLYAVELDRRTLMPVGTPVACFNSDKNSHGWERSGDYNEKTDAPWMEGSWMTKYHGKYYLQYAVPGTQFKSYCDGMYLADKPLGPFIPADNNPYSYKPEGFINGAGHSSMFKDNYDNYWQISTMSISVKHMFERRIGLFPVFFDNEGNANAYTEFGDFPFIVPQKKIYSPSELFPGWMLLSYKKPVIVSSEMKDHPASDAADEDIRTYWSATGKSNEWISIDMKRQCIVNAVQLNFAEQDAKLYGRNDSIYYRYKLEYSIDNKIWKMITNRSLNTNNAPHDFITLSHAVNARYVRLVNIIAPGGNVAMSGFRIFGKLIGALPLKVANIIAIRDTADPCIISLQWKTNNTATGFNIHYGNTAGHLYHNYQVLGKNIVTIRSLNKNSHYYFTIDSFNETGIQKGTDIIFVR